VNTKEKINHTELLKILKYDEKTGDFFAITPRGDRSAGDKCGYVCGGKYRVLRINKVNYLEHRLAWFYVHSQWPNGQIDHINGIKTDNRIENLRDVTARCNAQNIRKPHARNKSGFLGVHQRKSDGKWVAVINIDGKGRSKFLGSFTAPDIAHNAYLIAKRKYHQTCSI